MTTLSQERLYTALAIGGFVCLAAVAIMLLDRFGPGALSTVASTGIGGGATLWVVGNLLQLGGHRAVGLMTTHGNPLDTVGSIHFTVEMIDDAFELAAFALLGVGMLAWAWLALRGGSNAVAWGRYSIVVGVLMVGTAGSYAIDNGDLTNVLLLVGGVALPVWLVWSGRVMRSNRAAVLDAVRR